MALAQLWWDIATDETRRSSDRLEASKLLADRGWGKAAVFSPQEGDPLDWETSSRRLRILGQDPSACWRSDGR